MTLSTLPPAFLHRFPEGDFYVDFAFWGYALTALVLFRLVARSAHARNIALLASNIALLLTLPQFSSAMLAVIAGLVCAVFLFAHALLSSSAPVGSGRRRMTAAAGILGILGLLSFFKYHVVQSTLVTLLRGPSSAVSSFVFLIGISYSSFKAMHVVLEAYKGTLRDPRLIDVANYLLFFPAFISGPINRYNHFFETFRPTQMASLKEDLRVGLVRIVNGLFKKCVLTVLLFPYTLEQLDKTGTALETMPLWQFMGGLYVFAFYFYYDFSGYTDLAIGTARLFGFTLPENFSSPFLKKNIQQVWANWHMSLTSWLTEYVYWPIVRALRNGRFFSQHPVLLSNISIIITFIICGIWHGNTLAFLMWGGYHGIGIATVNTYQWWKRKVRNPTARRYFNSRASYALGVAATFNFFCIGLLAGFLDHREIAAIFVRFFS